MKTNSKLRSSLIICLAVSSLSSQSMALVMPFGRLAQSDTATQSPHEESGAEASTESKMSVSEELEYLMSNGVEYAANTRAGSKVTGRSNPKASASARSTALPKVTSGQKMDPVLARARSLAASGQYQDASKLLFQMSHSPKYDHDSAQIKYILGLMLYEMKLFQAAAFVFYDVVRQESKSNPQSRYLRQSLEKIALAADELDSDTLLRFAIKQVKEEDFPAANRDMLYFRAGEIKMAEKDFPAATRELAKVRQGSLFYFKARYKLGLALAEAGALEKAQLAFEDLAEQSKNLGVTDPTRVSALLGRARVLYQKKQFDAAIDAYRDIPRDTEQWHEALFESTWAMLMSARFRSALSNFHSLHSPYYEDFYQPESLFLRAIVYLYICKYDEMDRVMGIFERVYRPVARDVISILETNKDPMVYYRELTRIYERFDKLKGTDRAGRRGFQIPFIVARQILKEGDVSRAYNYLQNLDTERKRVTHMPANWRGSGVGQYVKRILDKRVVSAQAFTGRLIRHHLALIQDDLKDLFEQTGYLRFEMLSSKKESLRKEIAGKGLEKEHVDQDTNRNFYVQNGYEYWPFKGEYWLDEIGNYQYVGVKSCE
jgi:tetratricopeptide (TPR) repeat protein